MWGQRESCYVFSNHKKYEWNGAVWNVSCSRHCVPNGAKQHQNRLGEDLQVQEQVNSSTNLKMWRTALLPSRLPPMYPVSEHVMTTTRATYYIPPFAIRYFKCFSFCGGSATTAPCNACRAPSQLPFHLSQEKSGRPHYIRTGRGYDLG